MGEETYQSATEYEKMLKSVAKYYGYSAEDIDEMLADGFSMEEIEELFYS